MLRTFEMTTDDLLLQFILHDESFSQRHGIVLSDSFKNMHIEHSHVFYEIIYSTSDGVFLECSGKKYPLPKHHFTVIKPFVLHKTFFDSEDALLSVGFMAKKIPSGDKTPGKFGSLIGTLEKMDGNFSFADEGIRDLFEQLKGFSTYSDRFHDGYLLSVFLMLFFTITSTISNATSAISGDILNENRHEPPLPEVFSRELNLRYTEDITPQSLSEKYPISPKQINRYFISQFGETFLQRRTRLRMESARNLLSETGLTIKEIYSRLGYVSVNTFYSAFKKVFGTTPDAYRKSLIITE